MNASDGCTPFRELLSAQVDGQLQPGEEESLLEHLAACSVCQAYRKRLRRTVDTVRGASSPKLLLPDAARDQLPEPTLTELDARLEAAAGCAPFLELLSAQVDETLASADEDSLLGHLASCSACHTYRGRLRKTVEAVRSTAEGTPFLLMPIPAGTDLFAGVTARLEAAARAELATPSEATTQPLSEALTQPLSPVTSPQITPHATTPSGRSALSSARVPAGRLLPFPQLLRWAVAAAVLAVASYLAVDQFPTMWDRIAGHDAPDIQPTQRDPSPIEVAASPTPAVPVPTPSPELAVLPSPTPELTPSPEASPLPTVAESLTPRPTPSQSPVATPTPKGDDGGTRTHPPPPGSDVEIQLAELKRRIRAVKKLKTPVEDRATLIASLAEPRFDDPLRYEFLEEVVALGALDRLPEPNRSRQVACETLGTIGTPRAVAALLRAPLRPAHANADAASLLSAFESLEDGKAVAALANALKKKRKRTGLVAEEDGRLLILQALATLANPLADRGVIAVYVDSRESSIVRREAAITLGHLRSERALGPLFDGLESKKTLVRQGSAYALGELAAIPLPDSDDVEACVTRLGARVDDKNLLVRLAVVRSLGRTNVESAVEPLLGCLDPKGPRAMVRAADRALVAIAGGRPKGLRAEDKNQWRAFFALKAGDRPPVSPDGPGMDVKFDPKGFRNLPAQADGVVILVDTSSSMKAGKWELAVYEIKKALEQCTPQTKLQVIFLSDFSRAILGNGRKLVPATQPTKQQVVTALEAINVDTMGLTSMRRAFQHALTTFRDADTIYFLSDGYPNEGAFDEVRTLVRRLNRKRARPARVHAIHIRRGGDPIEEERKAPGNDKYGDMDFMRRLALENDGVYARN